MKIKSLIAIVAAMVCGFSANADHIAGKQTINVIGRVATDAATGNSVRIHRVSQRSFIEIIAADEGLDLDARELRFARLVVFDYGDGEFVDFGIEYYDFEIRSFVLYLLEDRFDWEFDSDIAGNSETAGGRWAVIASLQIDLIEDDFATAEFSGVGYFQAAVRTLRRGGNDITVPTAGLRSVGFPAVLFAGIFDAEEFVPGALTIACRTQAVLTDDIIVIDPILDL